MDDLNNYPVHVRTSIAWGEMDAMGHVNNIIYFRYYETARIKYCEKIGLLDFMHKTGIGPILAETSSKFIKPLTYPGNIVTGVRIKSMGKTSLVMEHIIVSDKIGVAAVGEGIVVIFDYHHSKKVNIPENIKEAIERLEKKKF